MKEENERIYRKLKSLELPEYQHIPWVKDFSCQECGKSEWAVWTEEMFFNDLWCVMMIGNRELPDEGYDGLRQNRSIRRKGCDTVAA